MNAKTCALTSSDLVTPQCGRCTKARLDDDLSKSLTLSRFLSEGNFLGLIPGAIAAESFMAFATKYYGIKVRQKLLHNMDSSDTAKHSMMSIHLLQNQIHHKSVDILEAVMIMALIEVSSICPSWYCSLW